MIFAMHKIEGLIINLNKKVSLTKMKNSNDSSNSSPATPPLGICPRETSTRVHMEVWFKDVYYSTREKE